MNKNKIKEIFEKIGFEVCFSKNGEISGKKISSIRGVMARYSSKFYEIRDDLIYLKGKNLIVDIKAK